MKHCAWLVVLALLCSSAFAKADDGNNETVKKSGSGRIVGGYTVDIADYPYTVVLNVYASVNKSVKCGGVIVASNKVLTAAHCLYNRSITTITIRAGSSLRNSGGFLFNHLSYIVHDQYDPDTLANDVAVITIRGCFDGFANVRKIKLQETEPVISSINPTAWFVVGWGLINVANKQLADRLQRGNFVLMPQTTGASRVALLSPTSTCDQSIQGGPLVCNNRLCGIVSFGPQYCTGIPDGFEMVMTSTIRSFIRTNAGI